MKPTAPTRRSRWFLARAMVRAYREMLDKKLRRPASKAAEKRSLFAEALEPRVLYSGSPMPADPNPENGEGIDQVVQVAEILESIVDTDATVDGIPGASFAKFGFGEGDLEEKEISRLAQETLARWEARGLTEEQIAVLEEIDSVVEDLGDGELYDVDRISVYLEEDAAAKSLLDDGSEWLDEEIVEIDALMQADSSESETDVGEGVDLRPVILPEEGLIGGLVEGSGSDETNVVIHGLFTES